MAKEVKRTTVPLNTRISSEIDVALRDFCDQRGEKIREVLEMAIRRHLANPPPKIDIPPLPPMTVNGKSKK